MKQTGIYLCKGLLFSSLLMTLFLLLLAFLMMQTGWNDSVMFPLFITSFCLSVFIGGRYYAKHAESRRFLWGILFGIAFFLLYLMVGYALSPQEALFSDNTLIFLLSSLGSGCIGGMLS